MNQRRLWSDPVVVAERRAPAESFMGRALELPSKRYSTTEQRIAAAHLRSVEAAPGARAEAKAAS